MKTMSFISLLVVFLSPVFSATIQDFKNHKSELDLNGNGVAEYFRYFKSGKLHKVKYDLDENKKFDYILELMLNTGHKKIEQFDTNLDGKWDILVECNLISCIERVDANFDGVFEKVKETKNLRQYKNESFDEFENFNILKKKFTIKKKASSRAPQKL